MLNAALKAVWEQSSDSIDTIVCGGFQKRRINSFISSTQRFAQNTTAFKSMVDVYESDFGICRVVLSRWVPADKVLHAVPLDGIASREVYPALSRYTFSSLIGRTSTLPSRAGGILDAI